VADYPGYKEIWLGHGVRPNIIAGDLNQEF
jgi:hypothetical protein